jgi:DNA-binding NarL/FixJ family response regulator
MTEDEVIKLVMADDHEIFRDGFRLILKKAKNIQLLGQAANGFELVQMVRELKPDVVITDIRMPHLDGIEATKQILKQFPYIGIIGLSMFDEQDLVMEMVNAGAKGYLVKNADKTEVLDAIVAVYEGKEYYCNQTSSMIVKAVAKRNRSQRDATVFSEKELEIIGLICREYTTKEIGDKLFMSTRTVDGYRTRLLDKMSVKNSVGIVVYAIQHGLYQPD